jgi:N-acetyl-gamma-glutamyl-phosphate reductase
MIKVGIVGGTGYTGVELLRILAAHPHVSLTAITSRGEAGTRVADYFPSLRGRVDLAFSDPASAPLKGCDCIFFATPNGVAMGQAKALLESGARIVDLSADFRLKDRAVWEKWYKVSHAAPELFQEAVYGLPGNQSRKDPQGAPRRESRVLCHRRPTGIAAARGERPCGPHAPHRRRQVGRERGRTKGRDRHPVFGGVGQLQGLRVKGHRHHPEIVESLASLEGASGRKLGLTFVPHLLPMVRGILATVYARITKDTDFQALYERRFKGEPFVDVLPPGSQPETRWVRGTNQCRIAVHRPMDAETLVVLAVEDNLVKGAAGQAVQNMNLMFGLPRHRASTPSR